MQHITLLAGTSSACMHHSFASFVGQNPCPFALASLKSIAWQLCFHFALPVL